MGEIRASLDNCRKKGKKITIWSENYDLLSYYIALSSNNIISSKYGSMMLGGFSQTTKFYKRLLDKLSINFNLVRPKDNVYKSAGEVYIQSKFTELSKQPILDYAKEIDNIILAQIKKDIKERNSDFNIDDNKFISNIKGNNNLLIDQIKSR